VTDSDHHLERQSLLRALAKGRKFPADTKIPPPASGYEKQLVAEARRRGIKAPRPNALTKQWRHYLEWQIGRSVVGELLSRRKRGQRGKQKSEYVRTSTEANRKKRDAYAKKKMQNMPTVLSLLRREKK
jgi:hypothetical protein